jgi:EmrB/QacA subfamily drug resistance transporter
MDGGYRVTERITAGTSGTGALHQAAVRHRGVALAILATCQGMLIADITIVTVAAPSIERGLGLSATNLTWVFNAYTIAFGGLLLLGGRAGDILGHRRTFLAGTGLFLLASLAAGTATSGTTLLVARGAQGLGAAFAAPGALALIANTFPEKEARTQALAIWSAVASSGMVVGLILGGVLTTFAGWRSVFFVNVPVGAAVLLFGSTWLLPDGRRPARLDIAGALTSTVGLLLLAEGFIRAASQGWADPWTIAILAVAVAAIAAFVVIETGAVQPILPLHLLAHRDRVGAYLIRFLLTAAMSSELFFLTLYLQDVLHLSPLAAGLAFVPTAVPVAVVSRFAGWFMPRFGARNVLLAGALITLAGVAWLTQLTAASSYVAAVLGPIVLTSIGCGLLFPAMTVVALTGVGARETGAASAMLQTTQQFGGALGVAALVTLFDAAGGQHAVASGVAASFIGGTVIMAAVTLIALLVIQRRA